MGLAMIYGCTKFEVSSFTRSKDTAGAVKWLDARGVVSKLTRGSPSFLTDPTKSDINIVEWSVLYANE